MSSGPPHGAREMRELARLALPLCVGHAGMHLMSVVDTAVLGHYRDASMAGAGIGGGVLFAFMVFGMGTVMGMDTLVPQALGAGETTRARQLLASGTRLALVLSLPLAGLIALAAWLLPFTAVEPEVASEASAFLIGRLPGLIPFMVYTAQRSYLQAHHITRPIVIAMVIGNVVNLAADWVLVMGDAGLVRYIRLACHGLIERDNDFVLGLIGKELFPLSRLVQEMRKTQQTALYLDRLGPFFVGRAVWQSAV